jgi:hypothetical protein
VTDAHQLVFIGGLHRSGTTLCAKVLAEHPQVSGLSGTGVEEDEGQHLQAVYPPAKKYGGPGHFARDPRAHLTDASPLVTAANARALMDSWASHWDLSKRYLLEKSPPNLIMSRFLQALFPDSALIMVIRHPVTVALSTKKWVRLASRTPWKRASLPSLVEHWLIAHELMLEDLKQVRRSHIVHYENLVADPAGELSHIRRFLSLESPISVSGVSGARSQAYIEEWDRLASLSGPGGWQRREIARRYRADIERWGYSLADLTVHSKGGLPG